MMRNYETKPISITRNSLAVWITDVSRKAAEIAEREIHSLRKVRGGIIGDQGRFAKGKRGGDAD